MGTSYKGNSPTFRSIGENVTALKNDYPFSDGYFGRKGESSTNSRVRNIESADPHATAKEFYNKATYGGIESDIYNKKTGEVIGQKTKLADGSIISWRDVSSSDGTPAVEINIEQSTSNGGVKQQKIHFVKEK
jgi:hypothetical protein